CLLEPEDPVPMRHRRDNIRPAIAVYVAHVYKAKVAELPIRMERPILLSRIGRSFQPAFWGQDVVPAIAVHIPHANAMSVAVVANDVLDHSAFFVSLVPGERAVVSELRQNLVGFAVVIKIN